MQNGLHFAFVLIYAVSTANWTEGDPFGELSAREENYLSARYHVVFAYLCWTLPGKIMAQPGDITQHLQNLDPDDPQSYKELLDQVYDELLKLARSQLNRMSPGETLDTRALASEFFLKLYTAKQTEWKNRKHFFAVAVKAMRRIVIDYARAWERDKRGGGVRALPLDEAKMVISTEQYADELLMLNDALDWYGKHDPKRMVIVEYKYFLGLNHEEIATELGISAKTVQRRLRVAEAELKGWLKQHADET